MTACDDSEVCDGNRFISWTETMREMASRRDGATSVARDDAAGKQCVRRRV